ncbi:MAG: class I SAM-dependent methyltransferase [Gammaproteobacteria bacterium]
MKQELRGAARRMWPHGYFSLLYGRASRKVRSKSGERDRLFNDFLSKCEGPCIQIAVKDEVGQRFGPNWTSVDKYDTSSVIDRHDDIESLEFEDGSFNAAVCWSVLEHVPHPHKAIAELYRVLKPGGMIWVQLPFLFPYHSSPHDYWRVTPDGLRIWMEEFEEVACACDYWARTPLIAATYFWGTKPAG